MDWSKGLHSPLVSLDGKDPYVATVQQRIPRADTPVQGRMTR